eukprot:scaffold25808_cov63-Phaeocystis_antarctica.AAC.3
MTLLRVAGCALCSASRCATGSGARGRGGAHERLHARGWGLPNLWRQQSRPYPSADELSRPASL